MNFTGLFNREMVQVEAKNRLNIATKIPTTGFPTRFFVFIQL
jgi:hypothetical protein